MENSLVEMIDGYNNKLQLTTIWVYAVNINL